jgi:hypothetical protein
LIFGLWQLKPLQHEVRFQLLAAQLSDRVLGINLGISQPTSSPVVGAEELPLKSSQLRYELKYQQLLRDEQQRLEADYPQDLSRESELTREQVKLFSAK